MGKSLAWSHKDSTMLSFAGKITLYPLARVSLHFNQYGRDYGYDLTLFLALVRFLIAMSISVEDCYDAIHGGCGWQRGCQEGRW